MAGQARFLAAMLLSVGLASGAFAQGLVECPTDRIETRVVTRLPKGWMSTPQAGGLAGTEVAKIGEKIKLVCIYDANGTKVSVMQDAPGDRSCIARAE